ncbi:MULTISPECIES: hypothetical protein [unclassified Breznakia]|uniref:hypothetical protein n=1 Tax=unclassified Breznakia TaxID=2623764 RepID=UPI0024740D81|nr:MULTISPECIES: hypothetical protein [unclassified Breznakia]MDH6368031.1 hypothetical protein [Breznakia sp. PH1-1]MDH6405119.1 hypothetical protein [Breznakia sp. PF1-11]MDH6412834.1 hypothetical protein [Breznakia sp. PFB1-11]MDH6415196.1 hypothetical protein [Breznakia sp. PFB1-14]MDH6417505.1 hypothetical protein [Breznakia sp. PFB1-4]
MQISKDDLFRAFCDIDDVDGMYYNTDDQTIMVDDGDGLFYDDEVYTVEDFVSQYGDILIPLPSAREMNEASVARAFIKQEHDEANRQMLVDAYNNGGLTGFLGKLNEYKMQKLYLEFKQQIQRDEALEWAKDNDIDVV